jgi:hypothetical protein
MVTIDLPKSQYRRIGEKPPSGWSWINPGRWAWIDWVIAVSLLLLSALLLVAGGLPFVVGGINASQNRKWLKLLARARLALAIRLGEARYGPIK